MVINVLGWGFTIWLVGYLLGILLFFFVPASIIGWVIMPLGILITLWVLLKKMKLNSFKDYVFTSIVWVLIAIICDYMLLLSQLMVTTS